ncbi:MAG: hypothetical protein AB7P23_12650 [Amphiplicatus sp.]
MIDLDYAARQIAGVWNMAWNREGWAAGLDRSVDGVFHSFWGILFAAPFALLGVVSLRRAASRIAEFPSSALLDAPFAFAVTTEMTAYVVDWAASLAALVLAARAMGASRRVADVIIGFNWLQPMIAIAEAAPLAIISFVSRRELLGVLLLPMFAFVLAVTWGVLRRSLAANVSTTVGLIALVVIVGFFARSIVGVVALSLLHVLS